MHFTKKDIQKLERIYRLNLINSVSGYKPANLIGTQSINGYSNLAIFSSVVHLGSDPAILGCVTRPITVERHTYKNIKDQGVFTINHVRKDFIKNAHYTSATFPEELSEFKTCQLTEEYLEGFAAPFVKESELKIGLKLVDEVPIKINGTILLIGEIQHLFLPEKAIRTDGQLDLNLLDEVCISGLNTYHEVTELETFPYARASELPEF